MRWLKHAFAVDEPGPIQPTAEQQSVVEKICVEVVRRHLATPALLLLEMGRPLNHLTAQAMHFFNPLVTALTDAGGYRQFAAFLERRGSVDYLCQRIEKLEADADSRNSPGRDNHPQDQRSPHSQAERQAES